MLSLECTVMKMYKFKTVTDWNLERFDETVEKLLNDGWVINGGISVTAPGTNSTIYAISLTKLIEKSA